ncbi:MAG: hypothetical protein AB7O31_17040 [Burkholderiales bacterium]
MTNEVPDSNKPDTLRQRTHDRGQIARRALLLCIENYSELKWAAGWLVNLEYFLWEKVVRFRSDATPDGTPSPASDPEIAVISWVAEKADGWWVFDADEPDMRRFVPLAEWLDMYEQRPESDGE